MTDQAEGRLANEFLTTARPMPEPGTNLKAVARRWVAWGGTKPPLVVEVSVLPTIAYAAEEFLETQVSRKVAKSR